MRPLYSDATVINVIAPGDIATIYDITPLFNAGIDGTGQSLAVVGQTDVFLADINFFRNGFGLTPISGCTLDGNGLITACNAPNFQYVLVGPESGVPSSTGDLEEADLDLEWHAIGPLQSNKCRDVAQLFDWVQTLDRVKLVEPLARR